MPPSGEIPGPASDADPAREFLEFWRGYFEQAAIQSRILMEGAFGGGPPDASQALWLESMSRGLDGFMRTPAFTDALKESLARMIEMKRMQDRAARPAAEAPGTPTPTPTSTPATVDVASVAERVRDAEGAILARLDAMEARLEAIERALRPGGRRIGGRRAESP
ncbi:hypothetical protein OJF2_03020 [Aquisphaera giovannonii]|uniref:Poly(3-hydroxyalkanoate) polymerase subunit PhaE n=1 Tax=Aquisphaera giovannonii TaxID=406548 RepID=A0A5B9VV85_9BACT|nr:hypothetical protein [Aquisphaera giovannonii]QEH31837.1 hypothetical protein OJF2_03020 [Aquisphaera giovannonii]